jgi:hypothetical protein
MRPEIGRLDRELFRTSMNEHTSLKLQAWSVSMTRCKRQYPSTCEKRTLRSHHLHRGALLSISALTPPITDPAMTWTCARVLSVSMMIFTTAMDFRGCPKREYVSPDSPIGRTMRYTSPTEGLTPSGKVRYTSPPRPSSISGRS